MLGLHSISLYNKKKCRQVHKIKVRFPVEVSMKHVMKRFSNFGKAATFNCAAGSGRSFWTSCFFVLSLFPVVSRGAAPSDHDQTVREIQTFDIAFLTEEIPDFPLKDCLMLRRGLELTAPDEQARDSGGTGGFGFADEKDRDVESTSPLSVRSHMDGYMDMGFDGREIAEESVHGPWTRITPAVLVSLIKRNIEEDSWANIRNAIKADSRTMVVRQRPQVLKRIGSLLQQLRAQRAQMMSVEVAVVPVSVLEEAHPGGTPWISSDAFDALVSHAGTQGKKLSLTAYNGQTVSGHSGRRRSILTDFDVNQTGVSPVINPLVRSIPLGMLVQVRPTSITGSNLISAELRLIRRRFSGDPERQEGPFGAYECARIAEMMLTTKVVLENGSAMIAGYLQGSPEKDHDCAVLCRVRSLTLSGKMQEAVKAPADTFHIRRYNLNPVFQSAGESTAPFTRLPGNPQDVITLITGTIAPDSWHDRRASIEANARELVINQQPSIHRQVSALIKEWTRRAAAMATVETWTLTGDDRAVNLFCARAGPGGSLPEAWRDAASELKLNVKTHTCISGLMGKELSLMGNVTRTFVADYECVSGGTTWTLTAIPDPIVDAAGTGFNLYSMVSPLPGAQAGISLRAFQAATTFENTALFMAPWEIRTSSSTVPSPSDDENEEDEEADEDEQQLQSQGASQVVFVPTMIDLPEQFLWTINRREQMPWNVPVVLEAHTGQSDGSVGNILIVQVKARKHWEK